MIKEIPDFPGYLATNKGRIIGKRGKPLKGKPNNKGYLTVSLRNVTGIVKYLTVHRLIAKLFIPNANNLPQVNHLNTIKIDNNVENLEWCTNRENCLHARDNGLYDCKPVSKYTKDDIFIHSYPSIGQAARDNNMDKSYIRAVISGKQKTTLGFVWKLS